MWLLGGPDDDQLERIAWRVGRIIERTAVVTVAALVVSILWQVLTRR